MQHIFFKMLDFLICWLFNHFSSCCLLLFFILRCLYFKSFLSLYFLFFFPIFFNEVSVCMPVPIIFLLKRQVFSTHQPLVLSKFLMKTTFLRKSLISLMFLSRMDIVGNRVSKLSSKQAKVPRSRRNPLIAVQESSTPSSKERQTRL